MVVPCARSAQTKNSAMAIAAGLIEGLILIFIGVGSTYSFGKFCAAWQKNAEAFSGLTTSGRGYEGLRSARLRREGRMLRSRILKNTGSSTLIFLASFEFVTFGFSVSGFPLEFSALPFPVF